MSTTPTKPCVAQIGEAAGLVWNALSENGPMTYPKLVKAVDQPRDLVMQAVGWLAREEKVGVEEQGRHKIVALQ